MAWVVAPIAVAWLTTPRLLDVLEGAERESLALAFLFGAVWGVGSAAFGLTMRYLGMALGMAVALGFCAAFGTLIPPLVKGELGAILATTSGLIVVGGVLLTLVGIAVCGAAGVSKERELSAEEKRATIREFALARGLLVAVIAGVMSAGFSYGITAGRPIAERALRLGVEPLYQNNATLVLVTAGGFLVNLLWCAFLHLKNRSAGDYVRGPLGRQARNYLLSSAAGWIWYGQFFFFGMGKTKMGAYDFSSWTLHMAFIIVFSNAWGLGLGEWRGSSARTRRLLGAGLALLILSTAIIGWGNSLAPA